MAMSSSLNSIRFGVKPPDLSLKGNVTTYTGLPNYIVNGTKENSILGGAQGPFNVSTTTYTRLPTPYMVADNENNIYLFCLDCIQRISYATNEVKIIAGKLGQLSSSIEYTVGGNALDSLLPIFQGIPSIDSNKNIYMIASTVYPSRTIIKLEYNNLTDTYSISEYAGRKLDGSYVTGTSFLSSGYIDGVICDKTNPNLLYIFHYPGAVRGEVKTHDVYKLTYNGSSFISQKIVSSVGTSPFNARFIHATSTTNNIYYLYYLTYNTIKTYRLYVISNLNGTPSVGVRDIGELGNNPINSFIPDNNGNLIITSGYLRKMSLSTYAVTTYSLPISCGSVVCILSEIYVYNNGTIFKVSNNGIINGWYCGSGVLGLNSPTLSGNRFGRISNIINNNPLNNLIIVEDNITAIRYIDSNNDTSGVIFWTGAVPYAYPPRNYAIAPNNNFYSSSICVDEYNNVYTGNVTGFKKYDRITNQVTTLNSQSVNNSLDNNDREISNIVYNNSYVYAAGNGSSSYSYNTSGNKIFRTSTLNGTCTTVYTDTSIIILGIKGSSIYYTDISRTILYRTDIGIWSKIIVKTGFSRIISMAADDFGNIYIADCGTTAPQNSIIKKLDSTNNLTNLVGGLTGYTDGDKNTAQFTYIKSMAYNPISRKLYVAEYGNLLNENTPLTAGYEFRYKNYYTAIREIS